MADFLVTTGGDTVDANDGVLSLREAIIAAGETPEADTILFAENVTVAAASSTFDIAAGQELTIVGDRDGDGAPDIRIDAGGATQHFVVQSNASLTLEGLVLTGAFAQGAAGSFGGGTGGLAVASIANFGALEVVRTLFDDSTAAAGNGGNGAAGSNGASGRPGADGDGIGADGGNGGRGGDGGPGGDGGAGGSAAGAILNLGGATLTLRDSGIGPGVEAVGGDGGRGGAGGVGGTGGRGGDGGGGASVFARSGDGGDGGNGGNGGDGGDGGAGGAATNGILNEGTLTILGGFGVAARGGAAGSGGSGGSTSQRDGIGGQPGQPGGNTLGPVGSPGRAGFDGAEGTPGAPGAAGSFAPALLDFGESTGADRIFDTVIYLHLTEATRTADDTVIFNVNLLGDVDDSLDITITVTDDLGAAVATTTVEIDGRDDPAIPGVRASSVEVPVGPRGNVEAYTVTLDGVEVVRTGDDGAVSLGFGTAEIEIGALRIGDGLSVEAAQRVAYIYEAGLDRMADPNGVNFWIDAREGGLSERALAQAFLDSPEFEAAVGGPEESLTDEELVEQLYLNVLDRPGEERGVEFWTGVLARPDFDRADLLIEFADSAENVEGSPDVMTLTEIEPGLWDFVA